MFDSFIIAKLRQLEKITYEKYGSYSYIAGIYSSLLSDLLTGLSTREQIISRIDALIEDLK